MFSAALLTTRPHWSHLLQGRLLPGAPVAVLSHNETAAIEGRRAGFELRDTLLILTPLETRFAFLFRQRLETETLDEQLNQTGTGALNIDGCRVGTADKLSNHARSAAAISKGIYGDSRAQETHVTERQLIGRWPSNLLFVHGPECQRVGQTLIDGHKGYPNGPGGSSSQLSQKGTATTRKGAWTGHADANGKEVVALWDCQRNCPVRRLDAQSGFLRSGDKTFAQRLRETTSTYGSGYVEGSHVYADAGGASRFFPQFADEGGLFSWLRTLLGAPESQLFEAL